MSWFKRNSRKGATSPLGLGVFALACGCFAFDGCPVDERGLSNLGGASARGGSGGGSGSGNVAGHASSGSAPTEAGAPAEGGAPAMNDGGMGGVPDVVGGSSGAGGSSSGTSGGGTAGSGTSGSGNEAGTPPVEVGCGDLDEDGVQDCEQTIALNANFGADVADWEAEPTLIQSWAQESARSNQPPGALRVRNQNVATGNGTMQAGSRQCVTAIGGKEYSLAVNTLIPAGQGSGSAGIVVWFFGSDNCAANFIGRVPLQLLSATGAWQVARGKVQAPSATRSMYVRLVTEKPFAQASFEALFDDVLVREQQ
jgi:hypothetical protein